MAKYLKLRELIFCPHWIISFVLALALSLVMTSEGNAQLSTGGMLRIVPILAASEKSAELRVTLRTGDDNLRGGRDNLDIGVIIDGSVRHWFRNVNAGQEWKNHTTHTVTLRDNSAFRAWAVDGLTLRTRSCSGISCDNWNLDSIRVTLQNRGITTEIHRSSSGMVHRFTGELPEHRFYWRGNFLQVTIWTWDDDLRGGDDNVNLSIVYADGRRERFRNVNNSGTWQDYLPQTVYLPLSSDYTSTGELIGDIGDPKAIGGLFVETTVSGGVSGDNWNIHRVRVYGQVGSDRIRLFDQRSSASRDSNVMVRITGDRRQQLFLFRPVAPSGPARISSFRPDPYGFNFSNVGFKDSFLLNIVEFGGLCGGMSYTALDYLYAGLSIPEQNFRPAPGTTLREYIYQRQRSSVTGGALDQWAELSINPGGRRDEEFFRWGLQFGSGRLGELIDNIDDGRAVPLGLRYCDEGDCSGDHMVVAYGYELGRYFGTLDSTVNDIKIYIYDPNHPDKETILSPDIATHTWQTNRGGRWQSYFVDEDYFGERRSPPSLIPYDDVIVLELLTGQDDLRKTDFGHPGGQFDVVLTTTAGQSHRFVNAYGGGSEEGLLSESTEYVALDISDLHSDFGAQLASVQIVTDFPGGIAGENWDLQQLGVRSQIGADDCILLDASDTRPYRFTGGRPHTRTYYVGAPTDCQDRFTWRE